MKKILSILLIIGTINFAGQVRINGRVGANIGFNGPESITKIDPEITGSLEVKLATKPISLLNNFTVEAGIGLMQDVILRNKQVKNGNLSATYVYGILESKINFISLVRFYGNVKAGVGGKYSVVNFKEKNFSAITEVEAGLVYSFIKCGTSLALIHSNVNKEKPHLRLGINLSLDIPVFFY